MSAVPITLIGSIAHADGSVEQVTITGLASLTGLGVGGGPIYPPANPPGIWGPTDPRPTPPIANVPGIDNPNPPGFGLHPAHPIVLPDPPVEVPPGEANDDGFVKPPPEDGGWGYHEDYGWGYYPGPNDPGPKGKK